MRRVTRQIQLELGAYPVSAFISHQTKRDLKLSKSLSSSTNPSQAAAPKTLDPHDRKARKSRPVEVVVHSEEGVSASQGVRPDQEVCENSPRAGVVSSFSARRMRLKRASRGSPDGLVHIPIHSDPSVFEEVIEERFASGRKGQKLRVNRSRNYQAAARQSGIQGRLGQQIERIVPVPERRDDVRVDRRRHCPRNLRIWRRIPFLPEGIPGFPIPRNFSNGSSIRTGVTRTSAPSCSKSKLSPGRTPRARRISCGTVIWPLLVIRAFFRTAIFRISLPYHNSPYLRSSISRAALMTGRPALPAPALSSTSACDILTR